MTQQAKKDSESQMKHDWTKGLEEDHSRKKAAQRKKNKNNRQQPKYRNIIGATQI